jgi:hypothetical protein
LIAQFAAANLLHGAAARDFLVRPLHRFHFLLRCAVRVRTTRFRQGSSEGVCPREIIRRKTDRGNRESKEEPLIRGGALRGWDTHRDVPTKKLRKMLREFLSAEEQEILLHSRSAKLAGPDVLPENWYLAWEQSRLEQ